MSVVGIGESTSAELGAYVASLRLATDKKSFSDGKKAIAEVGKSLKGLASFIKGTGNAYVVAGAALVTYLNLTSAADAKTVMLARTLRITSSELAELKNTALLTSVSSDTLTASLADLQKKSDRLRMGEVDVGLAKSLGMMGIGYQNFLAMDTGTKFRTALSHAMKLGNNNLAGELLRDTLGIAGKEMFQYMLLTGKTLDEIEKRAKDLLFTTDATRKRSMEFNISMKETGTIFAEISKRFVSEFGGSMMPLMKDFNNFMIENKDTIIAMMQAASTFLSMLTGSVDLISKIVGPTMKLFLSLAGSQLKSIPMLADMIGKVRTLSGFRLFENIPDLLGKGMAAISAGMNIFMDFLMPIKGIIDSIMELIYYFSPTGKSMLGLLLHGGEKGEQSWINRGKPMMEMPTWMTNAGKGASDMWNTIRSMFSMQQMQFSSPGFDAAESALSSHPGSHQDFIGGKLVFTIIDPSGMLKLVSDDTNMIINVVKQ